MSGRRQVSVSIVTPIPRSVIFSTIRNPASHADFDGSGTVKGLTDGSEANTIGDQFQIKMHMWGIRYKIRNTVVEYEKDCLIAWAHMGKHRWRYELEDTDSGTLITHTFDWSYSIFPWLIELAGYPKSHPPRMMKTLENLVLYLGEND